MLTKDEGLREKGAVYRSYTISIDDPLLDEAKSVAAALGVQINSFIRKGIKLGIEQGRRRLKNERPALRG